jgi:Tfp pilus assembly protein PilZ
MKILFATYDTPEAFLDALEAADDGAPPALRVDTKARYPRGETIILEIGFPGLPNRILARAVALAPPRAGQPPAFRFVKGEELKRDFLIAVAAGRASASWKRRHRRFPLRLPAKFVIEADGLPVRGDAETEDMGTGGLSLRTARTLPDGARVTIVLDPCDGSPELQFSGKVVWNRQAARDTGVGVAFDKVSGGAGAMKRLRLLIRGVKLRGETTEPQLS